MLDDVVEEVRFLWQLFVAFFALMFCFSKKVFQLFPEVHRTIVDQQIVVTPDGSVADVATIFFDFRRFFSFLFLVGLFNNLAQSIVSKDEMI